jgi:hypothetical protein
MYAFVEVAAVAWGVTSPAKIIRTAAGTSTRFNRVPQNP